MPNLRTCFVTKTKTHKDSLIRVYKTKDNLVYIGKKYLGKGFYILNDLQVIEKVIKLDLISRRLNVKVTKSFYDELLKQCKTKN